MTLNSKSKALLQQMLMQDCDVYPSVFEAREHLLKVGIIISNITQEELDCIADKETRLQKLRKIFKNYEKVVIGYSIR